MIIGIWIDTLALGDTIAAIPTCKKISEAYQTKVAIFTTHPQIFLDQPWALCVQHPRSIETFTDIKIHRLFGPIVGKSYEMFGGEKIEWRYSNMDIRQFHAVSQGFTLTEDEMETTVYASRPRELSNNGVIKDYVMIHPTQTWATRTWSEEMWQELVDQLYERDIPVIAVGRSSKESGFYNVDKPVMQLHIANGINLLDDPDNDIAELRWMMNNRAKCVVTMDSGILHVAGTTDVNIIQLGSSINPKLRAPYRKNSQEYKYQYVGGTCGLFCSSNMKYNVQVHGSIHGVPPQVYCLENKPTFECHPTVEQVLNAILKLYKK